MHFIPAAERGQHADRGVGDPFADRRQRTGSGQHRSRGQGQKVDKFVAHPTRGARVRDSGKAFKQPKTLGRFDGFGSAQLVKRSRDEGRCSSGHGLLRWSCGFENQHDLRRPCLSHNQDPAIPPNPDQPDDRHFAQAPGR